MRAGRRVSDDIGVIGYDDSPLCLTADPRMTTVTYRNVEIGEMAAKLLWKKIGGVQLSDFPYYLFQPELVVRDSCLGRAEST